MAILIIALPDLSNMRHYLLCAALAQNLIHGVTKLQSFLPLKCCWVLRNFLHLVCDASILQQEFGWQVVVLFGIGWHFYFHDAAEGQNQLRQRDGVRPVLVDLCKPLFESVFGHRCVENVHFGAKCF